MSALLASVRNGAEARLALEGGADIIDLKEPGLGALGAVSAATARAVVQGIAHRRPVSATLGDLPPDPARIIPIAEAMAATGVDYLKLGFFPGDPVRLLRALAPLTKRGIKLVAVLFADHGIDVGLVPRLAAAGLRGVMVDTAAKGSGSLLDWMSAAELAAFVSATRDQGLFNGLAGSLGPGDIPRLLPLGADYLGFRGALCAEGRRGRGLDPVALAGIRALIPAGSREAIGALRPEPVVQTYEYAASAPQAER